MIKSIRGMKKGNFFANAFKGIIEPSTYQVSSPSKLNGSWFHQIGSFFGYNVGGRTLTGFIKAFATNILVFMIVARLATKTAGIDVLYVDKNGKELTNSSIEVLLEKPNSQQGRIELIDQACQYFLTTGNTFFLYIKGVGMGDELTTLNSSRMDLKLDSNGEPLQWLYTNNLGDVIPYDVDDILHVKTSNIVDVSDSGVYFGLSPLQAAWLIIESSNEIFKAEAAIIKNRGIIGILSNESDIPLLKRDRERIQESFNEETGGGERMNGIKISNSKMKFLQTSMSPTDLKILEATMSKMRLLCGVYNVSSIIFNDNANATLNNLTEAKKSAYTDAYIPLGNLIYRKLSSWLSEKLAVDEVVKLDKTSIEELKGSTNDTINAINSLIPSVAPRIVASMTRNQAMEIIGLPALAEPLGSELVGDGKIVMEQIQNNES